MKKLAPEDRKTTRPRPRIKLLNTWSLIILTLTSICALWLVAPTKVMLLELIARSTSPEISLSFLKILSDQEPNNRNIKRLIAQSLLQMGNIREAITHAEPLLTDFSDEKDWDAYSVYLDAVIAGAYSADPSLKAQSTTKARSLLNTVDVIPDADIARKFADAAMSLEMPEKALHILKPHLNSNKTDHEELIELAMQTSDFDYALKLLSETLELGKRPGELTMTDTGPQKSYDKKTKTEKLVRMHQIYRWQGKIDKALEISLLIVADEPSELQLREALAETKALGDIYHEGVLFNQLARANHIKSDEYDEWLNALEKAQGTYVALDSVNRLRKQRPHDTALIIELSRLHSYTSDHQQVVKQYRKLKQYRKPTLAEATRFADAYIMLNQPQRALDVLTAPKNWLMADSKYLQTVLALAWDLSNKTLASASQNQLIARSTDNLDVYRYIQLNRPFAEEDIPTLVSLYNSSASKDLLLLAIRTAYESVLRHAVRATYKYGDSKKMDLLLKLALQNDNIKNDAEVLYYRALLAVHQNKRLDAHHLFMETLRVDKWYLPAITSYMWWAIDINAQKSLRYLYDTYHLPLRGNRELWPTFAAAAQQLGDYQQADMWYRKQLIESSEPDVATLIHYASLLEMLKQKDQARRLRLYISRHLSEELLALPDGDISLRSLVALIAGEATALELTANKTLQKPNSKTVAEFLRYQLALQQTEAVRFWHQRTLLSNYALPNWQELSIAIQHHDKPTMERLLAESFSLPLADRYYALQATGRHQLAWLEGQEKIGKLADIDVESQLRKIHVRQHPKMTRSIRSQYDNNYQWKINRFRVDYYDQHSDGYWRLGGDFQTAGTPDIFAGNNIDDEFRLRGGSQYQLNNSEWGLAFDIADGLGDNRYGIKASYQTALDNYWTGTIGVGLNNDIRASQPLATAGSDNLINLNLHYQPTGRKSLALRMNYHEMSTRFGDDIGTGWDGSIRASELIFFADPAWQVYGEYSMHRANLNNTPLDGINSWNQGTNTLTSADFLDDKYERVSLGQRFWHGNPGTPGPTAPSPRYWFDSSVGYNLITERADMTLSSGLGWRIIGNDELYFSIDWQSQDRNGDQSSKTSIGYFYAF